MSKEEIRSLLNRAKEFQNAARMLLDNRSYNLAAFCIEQALQFYLKYILANHLGSFPKTHSLSRLFSDLFKIGGEFKKFYEENELVIKLIEDAYILSIYYPREYSKNEVEIMFKLLSDFINKLKEWII
ncbi:MAG TPA: HEPN domain-containing protein [Geobacterales bacterium]|nr:HEPN domain-containing protein [Geobacterales bacterium]